MWTVRGGQARGHGVKLEARARREVARKRQLEVVVEVPAKIRKDTLKIQDEWRRLLSILRERERGTWSALLLSRRA